MKEIKLSQFGKNKGKYVALVDDEDFEVLSGYRWCARKDGNTFYAMRSIQVNGKQRAVQMHNAIMNEKSIDHIDHDGLNNQKSNLRVCTRSENMMNMGKHEKASSIYKGVCFFNRDKKWLAQIKINGKRIRLGTFASEIEAAKAYNEKAIEFFREFANLNIIDN